MTDLGSSASITLKWSLTIKIMKSSHKSSKKTPLLNQKLFCPIFYQSNLIFSSRLYTEISSLKTYLSQRWGSSNFVILALPGWWLHKERFTQVLLKFILFFFFMSWLKGHWNSHFHNQKSKNNPSTDIHKSSQILFLVY